jgi:hypothetical protein
MRLLSLLGSACRKHLRRIKIVFLFSFLQNAQSVFAVNNMQGMNNAFLDWTETLGLALPQFTETGLNWADSYIGQLMGYPQHFGYGLSFSPVLLDRENLKTMTSELYGTGIDALYQEKVFFPLYAFDFRIGGFRGIPFDLGFKIGFLPPIPLWESMTYDFFLTGLDLRYRVYYNRHSKTQVSIGLLWTSIDGKISGDYSGSGTIQASNTEAGILWGINAFSLRIAASQPVMQTGITLYCGIEGGYALTASAWRIRIKDKDSTLTAPSPLEEHSGISYSYRENDHFMATTDGNRIIASGFYGVSFAFNTVRLDAVILNDFLSMTASLTFNVRIQQ